MTATFAEPVKVDIAEPILRVPALKNAVDSATRYFEELLQRHKVYGAARELSWGSDDPSQPREYVTLRLREMDEYGSRQQEDRNTLKRMLDPVDRNIFVSRLLQSLVKQRWYQMGEKIDRDISELERQEARHALAD
jgi:hypothetical protein